MKKQMRILALFTCITAAAAAGGLPAFAGYGSPGPRQGAGAGEQQRHRGERGAQFFGKMAAELGLSDQQKAKARELFEKGRGEHRPAMEAMRQERQQLQALIHSGSADESAIRAQAAKVAALQSDLAVQRGAQAKQFHALLTPEQAEKLKDLIGKRKGGPRDFGCREPE